MTNLYFGVADAAPIVAAYEKVGRVIDGDKILSIAKTEAKVCFEDADLSCIIHTIKNRYLRMILHSDDSGVFEIKLCDFTKENCNELQQLSKSFISIDQRECLEVDPMLAIGLLESRVAFASEVHNSSSHLNSLEYFAYEIADSRKIEWNDDYKEKLKNKDIEVIFMASNIKKTSTGCYEISGSLYLSTIDQLASVFSGKSETLHERALEVSGGNAFLKDVVGKSLDGINKHNLHSHRFDLKVDFGGSFAKGVFAIVERSSRFFWRDSIARKSAECFVENYYWIGEEEKDALIKQAVEKTKDDFPGIMHPLSLDNTREIQGAVQAFLRDKISSTNK